MLDDTELAQPLCRVCFCGTEPTLKASGHLISPCSCTGSVRYIHLHCLRTWQATQRAQGRVSRSQCCELCGCKYSVPKKVLQQEVEQSTYLEKIQLGLKRIWLWFNDTAQGPMWQEALRYWRNALLVRVSLQLLNYSKTGLPRAEPVNCCRLPVYTKPRFGDWLGL